jgi:hypothetical protein
MDADNLRGVYGFFRRTSERVLRQGSSILLPSGSMMSVKQISQHHREEEDSVVEDEHRRGRLNLIKSKYLL